MKLIHISDLHIGKIVNGFNMIEDQQFALGQIIEMAKSEKADALIVAGDIYDKTSPSAEAVSLFDWFLCELSGIDVPVFAIPGNHDSAERIAYAQDILRKQGVYFPPVFNGEVSNITLQDEFGEVTIWLLPFLKPSSVRPYYPDIDFGQDYTLAIKTVLDSCEINTNIRNILVSHQFVTYSSEPTQREESELNLGGVDNVDASIFDKFDYVALGHVHRPQRIGSERVRYSGSLLKYSFSESRYPKSAVIIELGNKDTNQAENCVAVRLEPYKQLRDMRVIKGPLSDLTHSANLEEIDSDDYIKVILTDSLPQIDAMSKIRSCYPNVMQLEYEASSDRESSPSSSIADSLETDDPLSLFAQFFEEQTGNPPTSEQSEICSDVMTKIIENSVRDSKAK